MGQYTSILNPAVVPAPDLPEELVEEIVLRFAPDEPASLLRAALICKQWCRLVSGAGFRRRFREFHRTPPMVGFLCIGVTRGHGVETARFVPTTSTFRRSLPPNLRHCRAIDARHGRVLLRCPGKAPPLETVLVVWDFISDERRVLPFPTRWGQVSGWNAAVLCASGDDGPCNNHLDCRRGHFIVVFVDSHCTPNLFSTYSSDSGTWTDRSFPLHHPANYVSTGSDS